MSGLGKGMHTHTHTFGVICSQCVHCVYRRVIFNTLQDVSYVNAFLLYCADAASRSDWVRLNVGGKVFATTRLVGCVSITPFVAPISTLMQSMLIVCVPTYVSVCVCM